MSAGKNTSGDSSAQAELKEARQMVAEKDAKTNTWAAVAEFNGCRGMGAIGF
jgi:hypothetical protein